jgi:hypothetical protein
MIGPHLINSLVGRVSLLQYLKVGTQTSGNVPCGSPVFERNPGECPGLGVLTICSTASIYTFYFRVTGPTAFTLGPAVGSARVDLARS